jgi:hypothetical protein
MILIPPQVDHIGIRVETESSGQPYYPIYLFGPYKLLTVIVGCTIAFIWTVFPYPVTSRSQVRKLLGRGLFLLANFYSCMHTTIEVWIDGSHTNAQSSVHLLSETRKKLFSDEMTLITAMRSFSQFTVYEPPVGGRFPKSTYDSIISDIQSIVISMALMAKIPEGLMGLPSQQEQKWLRLLATAIDSTDFHSHNITSLLCHLSAAVSTGTALPPYLSPPEPFPLARKLRTLNSGLLDRKNARDPAFSAFASLEVLSSVVNQNLTQLIRYKQPRNLNMTLLTLPVTSNHSSEKSNSMNLSNASLEKMWSCKEMKKKVIEGDTRSHYLNALVLLNSHTHPADPLPSSGT